MYTYCGNDPINKTDLLGLCYNTSNEVIKCFTRFKNILQDEMQQLELALSIIDDFFNQRTTQENERHETNDSDAVQFNTGEEAYFDGFHTVRNKIREDKRHDKAMRDIYNSWMNAARRIRDQMKAAIEEYKENIKSCVLCKKCKSSK